GGAVAVGGQGETGAPEFAEDALAVDLVLGAAEVDDADLAVPRGDRRRRGRAAGGVLEGIFRHGRVRVGGRQRYQRTPRPAPAAGFTSREAWATRCLRGAPPAPEAPVRSPARPRARPAREPEPGRAAGPPGAG